RPPPAPPRRRRGRGGGGRPPPPPPAAPVASGSAERFQKPDPGPYPNMEECERARARYYDPSQLECVPVR
ncbi:hypothetical protein, partial [Nocardia wallacei]|uniref:hypothetical protein n=1 Tax=Nocardia wallacei TaxID=480035 RepID=UPI0024576622